MNIEVKNQKIWIGLIFVALISSLLSVFISLKPTQQAKTNFPANDNLCSTNDLLEIKMKLISRQTFNQRLVFSEGIYSLTEEELNNKCIPENFRKEYKIARDCYLSNKGCSQNGFFEELKKFLEITTPSKTN
ncbi:hypothetical protein KKC08_00650 [Patescibacteria group bacterium]|nr:hypothetical protein [Patescibacteria group bacterium]MCG2701827.1 hypothetical protein [Candidatus Parcubacteria bacterium]MBU4265234.1 hypothetical protein [Patescibacteria group bacterium]MBU4390289.1 hypothetical protein [Patescibacteria group bacterium]MBU4396664.1 hypothetical protein [Patescibacteria group bacterium]